jgi:hypothetical protein
MSAPERCMCGSEDCPLCYPLNRKQAAVTESHREQAIEQAVETLMDHGQYPAKGRPQLELYDVLMEERDTVYMNELYIACLSNMRPYLLQERIENERKAVIAILWAWLKGTDLVDELAQDIANEDE